jgi:phospho-N-acetylmuramoyl-pentapeptide-transferase
MERVILAAILGMLLAILAGPKFIKFMRENEFGQHIREEGPEGHRVKQGTPTMGGLLFIISASIPFLVLSEYTLPGLTVFGLMLGCAAIGFVDDYTKLTRQRSLGLAGRWKLLLLVALAFLVGWAVNEEDLSREIYVPGIDVSIDLWWVWYVLLFLIIAGAANGVNLTDGIDGLAAGTGMIALLTFTAINIFTFIRLGQFGDPRDVYLDMAILGGALIGAVIGFLWYNAFPAEVIMGDTGAMGIGGALAGFTIWTKTELLLIAIGGIFLIEALSVILQVISFRYWGRRIFLIAPIHHHFEMKAWSETKIMVRFWIVSAILGAAAFAIYYEYFSDFNRLNP